MCSLGLQACRVKGHGHENSSMEALACLGLVISQAQFPQPELMNDLAQSFTGLKSRSSQLLTILLLVKSALGVS